MRLVTTNHYCTMDQATRAVLYLGPTGRGDLNWFPSIPPGSKNKFNFVLNKQAANFNKKDSNFKIVWKQIQNCKINVSQSKHTGRRCRNINNKLQQAIFEVHTWAMVISWVELKNKQTRDRTHINSLKCKTKNHLLKFIKFIQWNP